MRDNRYSRRVIDLYRNFGHPASNPSTAYRCIGASSPRWQKMKKTVKQWCLDFGFDWYGPGIQGDSRYDYKIVYRNESGETTCVGFFASAHGASESPKYGKKRSGEFLLFPVYRQVIGQKEMSRHKFEMVSRWVQNCLLDGVCDYTEYLRHLPSNQNQTANQSEQDNPITRP